MAVRLGLRGRLFFSALLVIIVIGVPSGMYLEHQMRTWLEDRIASELRHNAQVAAAALVAGQWEHDALADRLGEATESRISIIDHSGKVVGDSQIAAGKLASTENHATRPEILSARQHGVGVDRRTSATLGTEMLYVAIPASVQGRPGIVRAAVAISEVEPVILQLRLMLGAAALIGLLVAGIMTIWASSLVAGPVRRLVDRSRPLVHGGPPQDSLTTPVADEDIAPGSVGKMAHELENTLAALARERDHFETVLQGMSEAVIALDKRRRITLANPAAEELLGLRAKGLNLALDTAVQAPELHELAINAEAGPASVEFIYQDRCLLARGTPLASTQGSAIVMYDLSEMRRLETIRKDFVANVSHELRTPVSIVRANAETLLDGGLEDPKRARSFVDAIHRHAERLSNLLADLLDLSRIEAGRYKLNIRTLDCKVAARRGIEAVEAKTRGRPLEIGMSSPEALSVRADPKALDQIFMNLLDNAIKYSADDSPVNVRVLDQGEDVRFEVVDSGRGIDAEQRERIFERFYRVDPGRSRDMGGTGLGLAIVKHLAESMGGHVGVDAAEPTGSIFWFTLPRLMAE